MRSSLSQCFASDDRVHFTTPHRLPLNPKSRFFAPLLALGRQVWGLVKKLGIPLHLVAPKESHPCLLPQFLLPGPLHHNAAFRTEPQMKRKTWKPLRFGPCLDGIVRPSNPEPSKLGERYLCLTPGKNPFPGVSDGDCRRPGVRRLGSEVLSWWMEVVGSETARPGSGLPMPR